MMKTNLITFTADLSDTNELWINIESVDPDELKQTLTEGEWPFPHIYKTITNHILVKLLDISDSVKDLLKVL